MSAKVTEAHRTKAHRIAEAVTSYFDAQDDCEFETNLIEDIAQALADAEAGERKRIALWHDNQAERYRTNELYPAYCLNAQVSTHEESAAAIRARGTPAKEKADG